MTWISFAFDSPAYLGLLLVVPLVWWLGHRSLSGLGGRRRALAVVVRSAVLSLLILALAEAQLVRITDRLATQFLLDQSLSLSPEQRGAELSYVASAVAAHRDSAAGDMAGVVVFGREASVEQSVAGAAPVVDRVESSIDREHTSIASALQVARATFPEGVAKRVVILSDGNENLGDAMTEARLLTEDGIGIDVAPLLRATRSDVLIERVSAPSTIRAGTPFDVTVVMHNVQLGSAEPGQRVDGRLTIQRRSPEFTQVVADQQVTIPPGKSVFSFRQQLDEGAFYTYEARFAPDDPWNDQFSQNNLATAFTHLQSRGQVLFIVNSESPDEFEHLIGRLRMNDVDVVVRQSNAPFSSLVELQSYDAVVLANVPRTSGEGVDSLARFSDEQVKDLVRNVEYFGAGLVMLGGPNSFGAGGWANTELERAMPVSFQIDNTKVAAVGALMLVIDKSGSMSGEKLAMSVAAAKAAVQMLGPNDQIGVVAFDSAAEDVVKLQRIGPNRRRIENRISMIGPGGGTDMRTGVRRGYEDLRLSDASIKHMIVLSDGNTEGEGYGELAARMKEVGVTTTTVAVGTDASRELLRDVASRGGGKYYQVADPRALPRIFTRETRRVARPLLYEDARGLSPQIVQGHDALRGITGSLPPITGFVLTTLKENPLVESPVLAPAPAAPHNTLVATWQFGLGRTVAVTTDAGERWASSWTSWEGYDQLFVQIVRWSMRPLGAQGDFAVTTDTDDGNLRVVVTGLGAQGSFLNGLSMEGHLVGTSPNAVQRSLSFEQVGPGRYVAETSLPDAGSYLLAVRPDHGQLPLRVGVNVPYSREFREPEVNEQLLLSLASLVPAGGERGETIRLPEDPKLWADWPGPNVFRHDLAKGRSLTSVWPLAVFIASLLFFVDVFNRRVAVSLSPLANLISRVFSARSADIEGSRADGRTPAEALAKSVLGERLRQRRYTADGLAGPSSLADSPTDASIPVPDDHATGPRRSSTQMAPTSGGKSDEEDYSARLLRVKREVRSRWNRDA